MIQNPRKLARFYRSLSKKGALSYKQALRIYEALHREAVSLGVINSRNILEGLENDIRLARIIRALPDHQT